MTIQKKQFADIADIKGLVMTCRKCSAELSIAIAEHLRPDGLKTCPSCGVRWLEEDAQGFLRSNLGTLSNLLHELRIGLEYRKDKKEGFNLTLELSAAPASSIPDA